MRAGAIAAPGSLQIFLADGTLVSDSCWETYRLSKWRRESDDRIAWQEDGIDVGATLVRVTGDELVLRLDPPADSDEQRFTAAKVPYVCPDMPRG